MHPSLLCLARLALPLITAGAGMEFASAHGGAFRGPADTVAPPSGGGAPKGPAGGSTAGPGALGGRAPQPGRAPGPSASGTAPGAPASLPADLSSWRRWWGFHQYLHMDVKSAVHGLNDPIGGDVFFLGHGGTDGVRDRLKPSVDDIHGRVVPALRLALEGETDQDLVTGCLIALAKLGDRPRVRGAGRAAGGAQHVGTAALLRTYLDSPNQEIAETAAVALGILGQGGAASILRQIVHDTDLARRATGRSQGVPWRTRAFAAYGMGLLGSTPAGQLERPELCAGLFDVLEGDAGRSATADIAVACVSAIGLLPLPLRAQQGPGLREGLCREDQLLRLQRLMDAEHLRKAVRGHLPVALARLCVDLPEASPLRAQVVGRLLAGLNRRGLAAEVQSGHVLALGRLVRSGEAELDREARAVLFQAARHGRGQETRRFALLALAESAARPGLGARPLEGLAETREFLVDALRREGATTRPWVALSLGVLGRRLEEAGLDSAPSVDRLLVLELEAGGGPEEIGGLALALGLRRVHAAADVLIEQLPKAATIETRGYLCQALGLLGNSDAIGPLRAIVQGAGYSPGLLRQASTALGLLGDKALLPDLVARMGEATSLSLLASLAEGLGAVGDVRGLDPLLALLGDKERGPRARAFAAVALGLICDERHRPWNSALAEGIDYRANVPTLTDGNGAGILEIF